MTKVITKNIKIPKIENFDNEYIENYLAQSGYDVIRWAITDFDENEITVSASYILKNPGNSNFKI